MEEGTEHPAETNKVCRRVWWKCGLAERDAERVAVAPLDGISATAATLAVASTGQSPQDPATK